MVSALDRARLREQIGRLDHEAPEATQSDDMAVGRRFVGVGGDRLIRDEVTVTLDGEAEFSAEVYEFRFEALPR